MSKTTPSALDVLESTFNQLVAEPRPLALDGAEVGAGLPARPIPLDELRSILLHPSTTYRTRDAAFTVLVRRAQSGEAARVVGLAGVLLPGLTRIAARLARDLPDQSGDIDAEVVAGYLAALEGLDPSGGRIAARLLSGSSREARRLWRSERAARAHKPSAATGAAPPRPWGHPDLILDAAVRAEVVSAADAEVIGLSRLEGRPIAGLAEERAMTTHALAVRRWRAERRLLSAMAASSFDFDIGL